MPRPEIVVFGGSAGAMEPLSRTLAELPRNFPGAIAVTLHTSPQNVGTLPQVLRRSASLPVIFPSDGERITTGYVYVAPPNLHLLINKDRLYLSNGPRENGFRPAIDPLFRSAARAFGPRAIGVILSGALDDGTFGLLTLKQLGGTAIVQHPDEAMVSSMPLSALQNVEVDHIVNSSDLTPLLLQLFKGEASMSSETPESQASNKSQEHQAEPDILVHGPDQLIGPPSLFNCPECGGVMWKLDEGNSFRLRCHTGHGFTPETLLQEQYSKLENALWSAVRVLRERAALYRQIAERVAGRGMGNIAEGYLQRAREEDGKSLEIESLLSRTVHMDIAPVTGQPAFESPDQVQTGAPQSTDRL